MIEKYINRMSLRNDFCTKTFEDVEVWTFAGDGQGDFELVSNTADTRVIGQYIEYCKRQIELCEKYLKQNTDNKKD
jgi:hypothetical protein